MTHRLELSHVLFQVEDLHAAVQRYRAEGFTVTWGGPPETAHNALIWFENRPFFELLTPPEVSRAILAALPEPAAARLERWGATFGYCDFALETPEPTLVTTVESVRSAGIPITDPVPFQRTKPDGSVVKWQLAFPAELSLPFVMSAYDPPQHGTAEETTHANGTTGIGRLALGVPDPAAYRERLWAYMGWTDTTIDVTESQAVTRDVTWR